MTDLDRLLELAKEVKYAGLDTLEEMQEYQSLYEKLSNQKKEIQQLKEELDRVQQSHDNYTKEVFNQHMQIQKLKQDSKTNADIVEKIKNLPYDYDARAWHELQSILKETK